MATDNGELIGGICPECMEEERQKRDQSQYGYKNNEQPILSDGVKTGGLSMSLDEMTVTIPIERYECLLDIETREVVLRDYINQHNYAEREEMMRILGHPGDADKIKNQEEKKRQEYSYRNAAGEVIEDAGTD